MVNAFDYVRDPNYVPPDAKRAKLILKLCEMIMDRYVVKYTHTFDYTDPEYIMLNELLTTEEVKFMLSFRKNRIPTDLEELAKRNHMTV